MSLLGARLRPGRVPQTRLRLAGLTDLVGEHPATEDQFLRGLHLHSAQPQLACHLFEELRQPQWTPRMHQPVVRERDPPTRLHHPQDLLDRRAGLADVRKDVPDRDVLEAFIGQLVGQADDVDRIRHEDQVVPHPLGDAPLELHEPPGILKRVGMQIRRHHPLNPEQRVNHRQDRIPRAKMEDTPRSS